MVLLTVGDAARQLGVAGDTVRMWERSGKLPAQRTMSGVRLFTRADVDRVAEERSQVRNASTAQNREHAAAD